MFVSPQKIRLLFLAKAIIVPPTFLALLVWAFVRVPPHSSLIAPKVVLSGNGRSWAWLGVFNSAIGFFATAGINMPDFTVSIRTLYDHPYT
jgi:NCS1 family nucleobase:cation symporter-1